MVLCHCNLLLTNTVNEEIKESQYQLTFTQKYDVKPMYFSPKCTLYNTQDVSRHPTTKISPVPIQKKKRVWKLFLGEIQIRTPIHVHEIWSFLIHNWYSCVQTWVQIQTNYNCVLKNTGHIAIARASLVCLTDLLWGGLIRVLLIWDLLLVTDTDQKLDLRP